MRAFILLSLLVSVVLLSACDTYSQAFPPKEPNPIYLAANKIGLEERGDRQELKAFLEIDPVRVEWCAAFVNSVLEETGIQSNRTHKYYLTARAYLDWGVRVSKEDILPGDIVVFPRGNRGWQGHVGFYIRTIEVNGVEYYAILGGNQNDKVSIELYKKSTVLGIRRNAV